VIAPDADAITISLRPSAPGLAIEPVTALAPSTDTNS
jgi:hypothetical protein